MAIWYSVFQAFGYSALFVILLKMIWAGIAIVFEENLTNFLGRSPGTTPFGFFAFNILFLTSLMDNLGAWD